MEEYLSVLKKAFIGDIYSEKYETLSDGGPRCYAEMTFYFKFIISIFSVNFSKNISQSFSSGLISSCINVLCRKTSIRTF